CGAQSAGHPQPLPGRGSRAATGANLGPSGGDHDPAVVHRLHRGIGRGAPGLAHAAKGVHGRSGPRTPGPGACACCASGAAGGTLMRVGIVCPYSFDAPGGVQFHVRDLAEHLRSAGHHAAVLAPAEEETPIPEYMTSVGGAIPVRYNGSVARLSFGPSVAARTGRWLEDGNFDVV